MSEVIYSGTISVETQKASANVAQLQAKLDNLDKQAVMGADGIKRLNSSVDKGAQAIGGLQQATNAWSQLMAGNFSGAMASGANAVKALWVAISANPIAAIALAVAGFSLYVYKYFDGIKKRAEENKKAMEDSRAEFENYAKEMEAWENKDAKNPEQTRADGTQSIEAAKKELEIAKEKRRIAKETAIIEQGNLELLKKAGADRTDPEQVKQQQLKVDNAKQAEADAREVVDIWKDKLTEIQDAKTKLAEQNLQDEKKRIDELAEYEKKVNEEVAKMKKDFERVQMEDAIEDPVAKLVFKKQGLEDERDSLIGDQTGHLVAKKQGLEKERDNLIGDLSLDADKRRNEIAEETHAIDKEIAVLQAQTDKRRQEITEAIYAINKDIADLQKSTAEKAKKDKEDEAKAEAEKAEKAKKDAQDRLDAEKKIQDEKNKDDKPERKMTRKEIKEQKREEKLARMAKGGTHNDNLKHSSRGLGARLGLSTDYKARYDSRTSARRYASTDHSFKPFLYRDQKEKLQREKENAKKHPLDAYSKNMDANIGKMTTAICG